MIEDKLYISPVLQEEDETEEDETKEEPTESEDDTELDEGLGADDAGEELSDDSEWE